MDARGHGACTKHFQGCWGKSVDGVLSLKGWPDPCNGWPATCNGWPAPCNGPVPYDADPVGSCSDPVRIPLPQAHAVLLRSGLVGRIPSDPVRILCGSRSPHRTPYYCGLDENKRGLVGRIPSDPVGSDRDPIGSCRIPLGSHGPHRTPYYCGMNESKRGLVGRIPSDPVGSRSDPIGPIARHTIVEWMKTSVAWSVGSRRIPIGSRHANPGRLLWKELAQEPRPASYYNTK